MMVLLAAIFSNCPGRCVTRISPDGKKATSQGIFKLLAITSMSSDFSVTVLSDVGFKGIEEVVGAKNFAMIDLWNVYKVPTGTAKSIKIAMALCFPILEFYYFPSKIDATFSK